jgi:hypothetical protein
MTMAGGPGVEPPPDAVALTVMWAGGTARWGVCGLCVLIMRLQDLIREGDAEVRAALHPICRGTLRDLDSRANVRKWSRPPAHLLPGTGGASEGAQGPTLAGKLAGRQLSMRLPPPVAWPASTQPGDWACGRCHHINFKRNWHCRACQASWKEGHMYEPVEATPAGTPRRVPAPTPHTAKTPRQTPAPAPTPHAPDTPWRAPAPAPTQHTPETPRQAPTRHSPVHSGRASAWPCTGDIRLGQPGIQVVYKPGGSASSGQQWGA